MNKIKLLVVDTDEAHIENVQRAIEGSKAIVLAGIARDGEEALNCISRNRPDVLLSECVLPGMDGIMLLKQLARTGINPMTILCTYACSPTLARMALSNGAAYVIHKPVNYPMLPDLICELYETIVHTHRCMTTQQLTEKAERVDNVERMRLLLKRLGFPLGLSGSLYVMCAMMLLIQDERLLGYLSKGLYLQVANRLDVSPAGVERAIRGAIDTAYSRGALRQVFSARPSNRQCLSYLYQLLKRPQRDDAALCPPSKAPD